MPQINLLIQDSKKKVVVSQAMREKRSDQMIDWRLVSISSFVGMLMVGAIWVGFSITISSKAVELSELEKKISKQSVSPEMIEKLKDKISTTQSKLAFIQVFSSQKILWHQALARMIRFLPDGVWLTEISIRQEKSDQSAEKRSFKNLQKTYLTVKGVAVAPNIEDAVSLIAKFIKNLQEDPEFTSDFSEIKLNNATKGMIGSTDIMKFDFLCEVKDE